MAEKAKKTPKQLLDECITNGNENGRVMTVNELITYANGENAKHPILYRVNVWFSALGKSPTLFGWSQDKTAEFTKWLEIGRGFFL